MAAEDGTRSTVPGDRYVAILTCREIDAFGHNAVFSEEIGAALMDAGFAVRIIDYRQEPRRVQSALADNKCAFMLCFNGFGSELALASSTPGRLHSAFAYYGKSLFDLMHDCPTHDSMAHQMLVTDPIRQLLLTDYGYVHEAQELGIRNVRFVPSVTFPRTLDRTAVGPTREIPILLPVQLPPPSAVDVRIARTGSYRRRVLREVFESVAEYCVADLSADPRVETRRACREAGMALDMHDPDHRQLLTGVLDAVKFQRRRDLVHAVKGLPVTLMTSPTQFDAIPEGFTTVPARSFRDLLSMMANSRIVICPLPHPTGHHERAMGAFTAGAAVVSSPNQVLETEFRVGREMAMYRSVAELADLLADLLADSERRRDMAHRGQLKALDRFSPKRLVDTILSMSGEELAEDVRVEQAQARR